MALLTVDDAKDYLKIQHDAEDTMLEGWLAMAFAACQNELGRPIETVDDTSWRDMAATGRLYGAVRTLEVPPQYRPFDVGSLVILDVDGVTLLDTEDYWPPLTGMEGVIEARPGMSFANGPYMLTADVGLETRADYSTIIEPAVNAATLDVLADRYQHRNPNATSESAGGGVSESYELKDGLTARARSLLAPFKARRA
jgi:hypothetical protein